MSRLKRALAGTATVAVSASALTVLAGVGVANAASGSLGNLGVSPTSGVANNASTGRPTFTSPNACPSSASAIDAVMNGPGWSNVLVLGNTPYSGGTISSQLADTFSGLAVSNSLTLASGTYTVTFQCLDNFGSVVSGATGDAVLSFGSNTASAGQFNNPWNFVAPATTTTTTVSAPATAVVGDNVTISATVSPTAAGTITFTSGGNTLGTASVDGVGTGAGHNIGSVTVNNLPIGSDAITASFAPTNPASFTASSGSATVSVGQATPTSTLTINPPGPKYSTTSITFVCTVAGPASGSGSNAGTPAGTATFTYTAPGASSSTTTAPVALTGGSASFAAGTFAQGTLSAFCTYIPASGGNYSAGSPSATQTTTIQGVDPNRVATEYIQTTVNPGALTLTVIGYAAPSPTAQNGTPTTDNTSTGAYAGTVSTTAPVAPSASATNVVILPAANLNSAGTYIVTAGDMIPVQAVDTRAGDPGYTVTGQLANLVGTTSSANKINAANFGWTPAFISSTRYASAAAATTAGLVNGAVVNPGPGYSPTATPTAGADGLSTAKVLYTFPAGAGSGTTVYGARLAMQAPTTTPADTYVGTLTLTAG